MINRDTASAPYNFIPFNKNVVLHDKELVKHDSFLENENRISGKITYELTNLTEMFVGGNGEKRGEVQEFFGDDAHYIIPGSTIRGLIRSNVEILSLSEADMIEDRRMMYRSFADQCKPYRDQYEAKMRENKEGTRKSLNQSIKAGYLYWKNEHTLVVVPAEEFKGRSRNFIKVHESDVRANNLLSEEDYYMYTQPIKKMIDTSNMKDEDREEVEKKYREDIRKFAKKKYKPYGNRPFQRGAQVVRFQIENGKNITFGCGNEKGYLFNSKWIDGKVNHYLVKALKREQLEKNPNEVVIDEKLVEYYEEDLKSNKQQTGKLGALEYFYNLPYYKKGGKQIGPKYAKLFFYRLDENNEVADFGPTPYFRIFHNYSIKQGIRQQTIGDGRYDYVSSLFGFVNEDNNALEAHYEGRLDFMNCLSPKTNNNVQKECSIVLMNPKPTAFQLYLVQKQTGDTDKLITYNDKNFELRGRKFYWKKSKVQKYLEVRNRNTVTKIRPLQPRKAFKGEIYFENLTEAELGLLLCAMQYESTDTDLLGHGKPYGYGKIRFKNIRVLFDCKKQSFLSMNSQYYDAFAFEDCSKKSHKSIQQYYDEILPEKIHTAVYSILREYDGTLVADEGKLSEKIANAINQLDIEGWDDKNTIEKNTRKYLAERKKLNKKYSSQNVAELGDELRREYSLEMNKIIENFADKMSSILMNNVRQMKMNIKIEELKSKFFREIKEIERDYDQLTTIRVYKKIKEIGFIDDVTGGKDKKKFEYMNLNQFKNRERLESVNEILRITGK